MVPKRRCLWVLATADSDHGTRAPIPVPFSVSPSVSFIASHRPPLVSAQIAVSVSMVPRTVSGSTFDVGRATRPSVIHRSLEVGPVLTGFPIAVFLDLAFDLSFPLPLPLPPSLEFSHLFASQIFLAQPPATVLWGGVRIRI